MPGTGDKKVKLLGFSMKPALDTVSMATHDPKIKGYVATRIALVVFHVWVTLLNVESIFPYCVRLDIHHMDTSLP